MKTVSFSQMEAWRSCRLKWWFQQNGWPREEPPVYLEVGKLTHAMLEADSLELDGSIILDGHSQEVSQKVTTLMARFYKADLPKRLPQLVEYEMWAEVDGVMLHGFADDICLDEGTHTLDIGEYKTSMSKPNIPNKVFSTIQPHVYRILAENTFPGYTVDQVTFTIIWPTGAVRVVRSMPEQNEFWNKAIVARAKEVGVGMIYPEPGAQCLSCDFREECQGRVMTGAFPIPEEVNSG